MNKNVFLWITILMLLISNMLLLYFNSEIKQTIGVNSDSNYISGILESSYKHMQIDGSEFVDSVVYHLPKMRKYRDNKMIYNLCDLLKEEKLVFYFPSTFCASCVSNQLYRLNKLSKEIGNDNIVFLTDYASDSVMDYILSNNINVKIYETNGVDIGLPFIVENDLSIGIFMLVVNQKVKTSFVLSAETNDYVEFFYQMLKSKYRKKTLESNV